MSNRPIYIPFFDSSAQLSRAAESYIIQLFLLPAFRFRLACEAALRLEQNVSSY